MPNEPSFEVAPPPRLAGPHLYLEPIHPRTADEHARQLFLACSESAAAGAEPGLPYASSLRAIAAGSCTAWAIHRTGGPAIGIAWLAGGDSRGPVGPLPKAAAGAAWAPGTTISPRLARELVLLLLGYAFEDRGIHAVAVRVDGLLPVDVPLLASEWPALRASLKERLAAD